MHGSRQQVFWMYKITLDNGLDGSFLTTATSNVIMSQLNKYNIFSSRPPPLNKGRIFSISIIFRAHHSGWWYKMSNNSANTVGFQFISFNFRWNYWIFETAYIQKTKNLTGDLYFINLKKSPIIPNRICLTCIRSIRGMGTKYEFFALFSGIVILCSVKPFKIRPWTKGRIVLQQKERVMDEWHGLFLFLLLTHSMVQFHGRIVIFTHWNCKTTTRSSVIVCIWSNSNFIALLEDVVVITCTVGTTQLTVSLTCLLYDRLCILLCSACRCFYFRFAMRLIWCWIPAFWWAHIVLYLGRW